MYNNKIFHTQQNIETSVVYAEGLNQSNYIVMVCLYTGRLLGVIILSVVLLCLAMLCVVMLVVILLSVIFFSVAMLSAVVLLCVVM